MDLRALLAGTEPTPEAPIVVATGAGMSVASGIPTFRGPEGYWTVGSEVYHPQDMATHAAFEAMPEEVWRWYLYRRHVCNRAAPNVGHRVVAALEQAFGDGFACVTQNVDGLHVRGGCSRERVFEVHGSIDMMRDLGTGERVPIPDGVEIPERDTPMSPEIWDQLVNPATGNRCRPHVLWFDEFYDEENFRIESALGVSSCAQLMIVVGTSGAARAPYLCLEACWQGGGAIVDIGPEDNPFRTAAQRAATHGRGAWFEGTAVEGIAIVAEALGLDQREA